MKNIISSILVAVGLSSSATDHAGWPTGKFFWQESYTFVNGNGMNALQLRKIFKFLPKEDKEFQFPEVKVEELK